MAGIKYPTKKSGEWFQPVMNGHRMACCDCSLVHTMDFKVVKGKVYVRAFRNNRATGQKRRHAGITIETRAA